MKPPSSALMQDTSPTDRHPEGLSPVVERNIRALIERRQMEDRARTWHERAATCISNFAGSIAFVYLHLALFSAWIMLNTLPLPVPRFDPSLVILAMFASVEAIFLSTFVLINQNRMAAKADKRAELDLQISLLAEHEITRLITMLSALCEHAGVPPPEPDELAELQRDVAPEKVLDRLDEKHGE